MERFILPTRGQLSFHFRPSKEREKQQNKPFFQQNSPLNRSRLFLSSEQSSRWNLFTALLIIAHLNGFQFCKLSFPRTGVPSVAFIYGIQKVYVCEILVHISNGFSSSGKASKKSKVFEYRERTHPQTKIISLRREKVDVQFTSKR